MINKSELESVLVEQLRKEDLVLVDMKINTHNVIKVLVDSLSGVPISKCVEISRFIENYLDRDKEDFELEVSSYSIVLPFVLPLHYKKNIGRQVEMQTLESASPIKGVLKTVELDESGENVDFIEIVETKKIKPDGKKKKIEVEETHKINGSEIKQIRLVPIF